jgi:uncharacterized membrane protein (UPF0127 family)/CheY-like chemotaxis protein
MLNMTAGKVVCEKLVTAERPLARMRGLLGRESLAEGEGLLLTPAASVHTGFMRFEIDVVLLNRDLEVIKLVERLRPWRTASAPRARAILELAAGEVAARGIALHDRLAVVEVHGQPGTVQCNGHGPDHTRVLLIGTDRRFRAVAAALLTRRGYEVTVGERSATAWELASAARVDDVVLDSGASLTAAAHAAARLETLEPPVGIVVVGEEFADGIVAMPVVAKWGAFDRLYQAIEQVRPPRRHDGWD